MKNIIVIMMLAVGLSAFAQERGNGRDNLSNEEMATLSAKRLAMQLDLDAKQEAELKKLYIKRMDEREELMKERREDRKDEKEKIAEQRAEMRKDHEEVEKKYETEMQAILTPEQFTKYKELQEKRRKGRRDPMHRKTRN